MRIYAHGGVAGTPRPAMPLAYCFEHAAEKDAALDAVELAVMALEDDPALNAGFGATLDLAGQLELDAGIADGLTGRCGGVANVTVRHPISLARRVMEATPHVLITGRGAAELGADMEQLSGTSETQSRRWQEAKERGALAAERFADPEYVDTVGAVALDDRGGLAAGSSTGGVFGKMPGRVGDAPVFGAGYYASGSAAVVGTGVGEVFLQTLACWRAAQLIEGGIHPQRACEEVIALLAPRRTTAGLLALDVDGRVGAAFRGASWSVEGTEGPFAAVRRP